MATNASQNYTVEKEEPVISLEKQKEAKLREFREYLVDKNVVLALVKCNPHHSIESK